MFTACQRLGLTRRDQICNWWCTLNWPRQSSISYGAPLKEVHHHSGSWNSWMWKRSLHSLWSWDENAQEIEKSGIVRRGCFSLGILARQAGKHFPEANRSGWWEREQVPLSTDAVTETNFPFHWNLEALRSNFRLGVAMVFCQEIKLSHMQVFLGCF